MRALAPVMVGLLLWGAARLHAGALTGGRVLFTMEGRWELTLRVIREGKRFELPVVEHVGR